MPFKSVPDRWLDYGRVGDVVEGTRFIAFKVPLKEAVCQNLPSQQRFTTTMLMDQIPKLSLVVDLTFTDRYYNRKDFETRQVLYKKIYCPGQVVPPKKVVTEFFAAVDEFLDNNKDNDAGLIGVHCTHGLNRTGYFICKYMIERLGVEPDQAIRDFNQARGHEMERQNYLADLKGLPFKEEPDAGPRWRVRGGGGGGAIRRTTRGAMHAVNPYQRPQGNKPSRPATDRQPAAGVRSRGRPAKAPAGRAEGNAAPSRDPAPSQDPAFNPRTSWRSAEPEPEEHRGRRWTPYSRGGPSGDQRDGGSGGHFHGGGRGGQSYGGGRGGRSYGGGRGGQSYGGGRFDPYGGGRGGHPYGGVREGHPYGGGRGGHADGGERGGHPYGGAREGHPHGGAPRHQRHADDNPPGRSHKLKGSDSQRRAYPTKFQGFS